MVAMSVARPFRFSELKATQHEREAIERSQERKAFGEIIAATF
jgi:hypothetical protein